MEQPVQRFGFIMKCNNNINKTCYGYYMQLSSIEKCVQHHVDLISMLRISQRHI
jgi:hypothetical protein